MAVAVAAAAPARGGTLVVGHEGYDTIQQAIDAASSGDTVLVMPGRYQETVSIAGKDIHLIAPGGPTATVIDGAGVGPVIHCVGLTANSSIQGFTITGGVAPLVGGGIYLAADASPVIRDNVVTGNRADVTGGGTLGEDIGAVPLLCEPVPGSGGGIYVYFRCTPTIVDNVIRDNWAARDGGGVVFWDHADARLERNHIYRNEAERYGGAVYVGCNASPTIEENVMAWNAAYAGAGIYLDGKEADAEVLRNTLYRNYATDGAGGIQCAGACIPVIRGNLILECEGGGILCDEVSEPDVWCNNVWGGSGTAFGRGCFPYGGGVEPQRNGTYEVKLCGEILWDFRACENPLEADCGQLGSESLGCPPQECGTAKGSWGAVKALYRTP